MKPAREQTGLASAGSRGSQGVSPGPLPAAQLDSSTLVARHRRMRHDRGPCRLVSGHPGMGDDAAAAAGRASGKLNQHTARRNP